MADVGRRRWTLREVRQLIDENPLVTPRYELVDGELLVTPSPAGRHQLIVTQLLVALSQYAAAQRIGEALTSPSDVELEDESLTQPDIYVLPREELKRVIAPGYRPGVLDRRQRSTRHRAMANRRRAARDHRRHAHMASRGRSRIVRAAHRRSLREARHVTIVCRPHRTRWPADGHRTPSNKNS